MNAKLFLLYFFLLKLTYLTGQPTVDTTKPWTYWWWMGSAVNQADIKDQLTKFARAGLGGVHIIPIYGAKGYEEQFLPFLSEEWMEAVQFTTEEAEKLGLGVDLTLGTGWPYGGGWINESTAAKKLVVPEYEFEQASTISFRPDSIRENHNFRQLIAAIATNGRDTINLTTNLSEKLINYNVPPGDWKLTLFGVAPTRQRVKRAAPGGEGWVMDYFDERAVNHYLHHFDSVFANTEYPITPRSFYHDSYEAYGANWSRNFLEKFSQQHGYELLDYIAILTDTAHADRLFIIHDIRATLSEQLYQAFTSIWKNWCEERGALSRNQAHGSPGNILDLYALADIPETESFGCSEFGIPGLNCDPDYEEENFGRPSPLMMKFASSPAHLLGKPLVSSETGTWLANHFKVSLSRVKPQIDELLVSGINHVFYHGTTYSPQKEPFPGWLFYASTNFGPSSHFWDELPLLNSYIEQCQDRLQSAEPDNDILLYFPINDLWSTFGENILLQLDVHKYENWFSRTAFGETAQRLWDQGFTFDYVSDRQLQQLDVNNEEGLSTAANTNYSLIVVPAIDFIPEATLRRLDSLAQRGARIVFLEHLPKNYAGFLAQQRGSEGIEAVRNHLLANPNVTVSDDVVEDLKLQNVRSEEMKPKGLDFIRKKNDVGYLYFITNLGNTFLEDTLSLAVEHNYLTITDPQTGSTGYIEAQSKFNLRLPPGKSYFIQTSETRPENERWNTFTATDTLVLDNPWTVNFIQGNTDSLQSAYTVDDLSSWTVWDDEQLKTFSGKGKYTARFTMNNFDKTQRYRLVFEDIRETAEVIINGVSCGTVWAHPYQLEIPTEVLKEENEIEIIVQNLSANYMKLYDRQHPEWKKFYDINIVDITYQPFDASRWDYQPSGLIGEVLLISGK
jgi:hypothetical protein